MKFFLIICLGTLLSSIYCLSLRSGNLQLLGNLGDDPEIFGGAQVRKIEVRSPVSGVLSKINVKGTGYHSPGTAFVITAETSQYYKSTVNTGGKSVSVKRIVEGGRNVYVQIFREFFVLYLTNKKIGDTVSQYDLLALIYVRRTQPGETSSVHKLPRSVPTTPISPQSVLGNEISSTNGSDNENALDVEVPELRDDEKNYELINYSNRTKTPSLETTDIEDQEATDDNFLLTKFGNKNLSISEDMTSIPDDMASIPDDITSIPDKIDEATKNINSQLSESNDKDSEFELSEFISDSEDSKSESSRKLGTNKTEDEEILNSLNITSKNLGDKDQEVTLLLESQESVVPLGDELGHNLQTETRLISVSKTTDSDNESESKQEDNIDEESKISKQERLGDMESKDNELKNQESTGELREKELKGRELGNEDAEDELKVRESKNEEPRDKEVSEATPNGGLNTEDSKPNEKVEETGVKNTASAGKVKELNSDEASDDEIVTDDIKTDELKTEESSSNESKSEEPKSDETKGEEPKSDETKGEEPKSDETKGEEPKSDETKSEEPRSDETKGEEPKSDETKGEEPKSDETKGEEPKSDETKGEEPKSDETKGEEPKSDETKGEEPKSDETKGEEPKSDETKGEESKSDEIKTEEPKSDEAGGEQFPGLPESPIVATVEKPKAKLEDLENDSSDGLADSGGLSDASLFSAGRAIGSDMDNSGSAVQDS